MKKPALGGLGKGWGMPNDDADGWEMATWDDEVWSPVVATEWLWPQIKERLAEERAKTSSDVLAFK